MAKPGAYAQKITMAKAALSLAERQALVHRCVDTMMKASAVALNEQFGFGADRVQKFRESVEAVMEEYGAIMAGADVDYADDKLTQAFERIMRPRE